MDQPSALPAASGIDITIEAIDDALRDQSERQAAEPQPQWLPATGTTRISRVLAEARKHEASQRGLPLGRSDASRRTPDELLW